MKKRRKGLAIHKTQRIESVYGFKTEFINESHSVTVMAVVDKWAMVRLNKESIPYVVSVSDLKQE